MEVAYLPVVILELQALMNKDPCEAEQ